MNVSKAIDVSLDKWMDYIFDHLVNLFDYHKKNNCGQLAEII